MYFVSSCYFPCHFQPAKECYHSSHSVTIVVVCAGLHQERDLSRGSGFHIGTGVRLEKGCGAVTCADEHRRGFYGPSYRLFTRVRWSQRERRLRQWI